MKLTNLALILLGVIACAHTLRADDVEVIDVDDDGSSSVSTSTPDMLPEYYNDIGLQLLNGAELKDRVSQGGRRGVKATQDIAPNSEVMRVPITSIISMGGIQKYPDLTKALSGSSA